MIRGIFLFIFAVISNAFKSQNTNLPFFPLSYFYTLPLLMISTESAALYNIGYCHQPLYFVEITREQLFIFKSMLKLVALSDQFFC